jgi:ribosomal protein S18 acetylase RimI-like enzyme
VAEGSERVLESNTVKITESTLRKLIRETLLSEVEYSGEIEYRVNVKNDPFYMVPTVTVSAVKGSLLVGKIKFVQLRIGYQKTIADEAPRCYSDIQALADQGMVASTYWYPEGSDVKEEFRGLGLGKALYRAALGKIRELPGGPHIALPANCTSHIATSQSAQRVWDSIAPEYRHSGRVIYLG